MNSKSIAAVIVVIVVIVAAVCAWQLTSDDGGGNAGEGDTITVVDSSDRTVTVNLPVQRVAICDPTLVEIFAMAVGDGWEDYVCLLSEDIQTREPAKWELLKENYPSLADLPMCGDLFANGLPAEDIIAAEADLVLIPGATANYMPGMNQQIQGLEDMGISVVYLEFYDKSFTEGIAEKNIGILGDIMGTSDVADRVVEYYDEAYNHVIDTIADNGGSKDFTFYVELPMSDPSIYGSVVAMGCPEFNVLGGTNICTAASGSDQSWNLEKMQNPDGDGPDYIVMVSTPYYGAPPVLGYGATDTDAECQALIDQYTSRPGWDSLKAVEDGNVIMCYGELRNSVFGLVDLYSVAMMIYPELFTQEDLDEVISTLDELSPFGFDGTWSYQTGA